MHKKIGMAVFAVVSAGVTACSPGQASQGGVSATAPGQVLTPANRAPLSQVLANFLGRDAAELKTVTTAPGTDGLVHVQLQQELSGVRVLGATVKATATSKGELVHVIDTLAPSAPLPAAHLSPQAALVAAMAQRGLDVSVAPALRGTAGQVATFEPTAELTEAPTVERVAFVDAAGVLQVGALVETWTADNVLVHTLVDDAGRVVRTELRTNNDAYNVFVEDPSKGAQTIVAGPGAGNTESPAGWLSGAQLTVNITGNNANAYLDADANNRADRGGTSVANGQFLTAVDLNASPTTTGNRAVAVQNLFYLNNVVHDVLYRHGFNEAAGNFQVNNFGKGGAGADPVLAEAQDGSGTDNANMSTPTDGRSPRMQMYLWTGKGFTHEVVIPSGGAAGTYGAAGADFGAALTTTGLTGAIALVNDGTAPTNDGCEAMPLGSLTGKIALISRGTCNFVVKAKLAQDAGATGVIIFNNTGGDQTFAMSGTDRKVKIPSVMVSQNTGAILVANLAGLSGTERKKAQQPLQVDGDVDSDIVFHEYGHGLTWRMIGGMSGKLAGAIGEGASDVVAFLIDGDDRIGEYAWGDPAGIRRYPYAGYPLTYGNVTGAEVHDDGEIYAAAMWRLNELILAAGGTSDELMTLFVDGMNYTPATPAFEDMRDGMIQASNNRGGARTCLIWQAFAQYGIGVGADGVATTAGVTITPSFAMPASCP